MIIHKRIQCDFEKGSVEIQINFDVFNNNVKVSKIQIHSTFDSGLPALPTFEEYKSKSFLVAHYCNADKKIFERIVGNIYADTITEQIREMIIEISKSL
ncbi:MAG: hypothetical protein H7239_12690 [Flavobacterium sp.]|nr:hypothetical protein [Flavobacterium sp.]